ncbi:MAG: c-type cytochrome [Beijerinckiaceae bacterium]
MNRSLRNLAAIACIAAAAPALAETLTERLPLCFSCHGEKGTSETPEIPSLGGQPASFLLIQLYQFREKQRLAEPMNEMTKDFTDDDLRAFSDELAKLPPPSPADSAEPARFEQGRAAAQKYRCGFCHNPDLSGHDQIGRIGDQREDYLVKALRGYKSGERNAYDPAMIEVVQEISDEDIAAIAHYVAHFKG